MADPSLAPFLADFAAAYGAMLAVPGPNTLLVLRACDGRSRLRPLLAAAGVACGATLAAAVAASSAAALPSGPGFRIASGLLVAGFLLRAALGASKGRRPAAPAATAPVRMSAFARAGAAPFLAGLCVAGLNPVSVPYFAGFFASHACGGLAAGLACVLVFALAGLWFSAVALASDRLRRLPVPVAGRRAFDLITAAVLTGLALRHLWMAVA